MKTAKTEYRLHGKGLDKGDVFALKKLTLSLPMTADVALNETIKVYPKNELKRLDDCRFASSTRCSYADCLKWIIHADASLIRGLRHDYRKLYRLLKKKPTDIVPVLNRKRGYTEEVSKAVFRLSAHIIVKWAQLVWLYSLSRDCLKFAKSYDDDDAFMFTTDRNDRIFKSFRLNEELLIEWDGVTWRPSLERKEAIFRLAEDLASYDYGCKIGYLKGELTDADKAEAQKAKAEAEAKARAKAEAEAEKIKAMERAKAEAKRKALADLW